MTTQTVHPDHTGDPPRARPRRRRDLRRQGGPVGWLLLAVVVAWLVFLGDPFELYVAGLVIIYAISALGLDWIQGRAGQVSIGSAAFMAVGAYVAATAAGAGLPMLLCLLFAAIAGAVVGFIFGLPALRLRGLYLALSTLALQFITSAVGLYYETAADKDAGFFLPPSSIGGLTLQGTRLLLYLVVLLVLTIVVLRNLYARAPGRAWLAINESQPAAAVIGVDTNRWKMSAFVWSSGLISLSGGLLGYYTLRVFGDSYSLTFALTFVAMVIVGGLGSIPGVVLGATLITISPYVLSSLTAKLPSSLPIADWLTTNVFYVNNGLYGILLLFFLLFQPRGFAGALQSGGRWLTRRLSRRDAAPAPAGAVPVQSGGAQVTALPTAAATGPAGGDARPSGGELLAVRDLSLVYRTGAQALSHVDLHVDPGEIVALLGRNGAGKTSTLRAISGFFASDRARRSGSVIYEDRQIVRQSPVVTARRGLVLVAERDKVFPNLTVAEHFQMVGGPAEVRAWVDELFPALRNRLGSQAGLLSGGERQMLALALAWCMQPKLLLVDELSLGLAPAIVKRLMASLQEFRDRTQVPILLVEQNVSAALDVADRIYIMEAGEIVHEGTGGEVSREAMLRWSFGRS